MWERDGGCVLWAQGESQDQSSAGLPWASLRGLVYSRHKAKAQGLRQGRDVTRGGEGPMDLQMDWMWKAGVEEDPQISVMRTPLGGFYIVTHEIVFVYGLQII